MFYRAFGLGLAVDRPIAGLAGSPTAAHADVRISLGSMPAWRDDLIRSCAEVWHVRTDPGGADAPPLLTMWKLSREHIRLLYGDGVDFLLDRSGSRIWATWPGSLTPDDVSSYLLGPILGYVLRLRWITGLHASGIVIDGRAALFVGASGAGKSTTAAAFLANGHRVLADDVVPVSQEGGLWLVRPGYPRLRLWPSAIKAAGHAGALSVELDSLPADRRHHLNLADRAHGFQYDPLPLGAVYLLGERSYDPGAPVIGPIEPANGLMALVANTFANTLLDSDARRREFDELSRMAADVPIRRVCAHADAARLDELCGAILEDFRTCVRAKALARAE